MSDGLTKEQFTWIQKTLQKLVDEKSKKAAEFGALGGAVFNAEASGIMGALLLITVVKNDQARAEELAKTL